MGTEIERDEGDSMTSKGRILAAAAAAALSLGSARAEVLEITGEFAAPAREASMLESIAVGRIGGEDGPALQIAIERALTNSQFDLLAGRTGLDNAEGTISGAVTTEVDERSFTRKEKKCVTKDDKGKCTKEEEVDTPCKRRIVSMNADLRIVRNSDGRIVHSTSRPFRQETSWCRGQNPANTTEETVANGIREIAGGVRSEIVPQVDTYRIRVRESTKGMSKEAAGRFKDMVRLTKSDARAACDGWAAMEPEEPGHASLLFNLGLCAEQRGDYAAAIDFYQQAVRAGASEGGEGAGRAARLAAGREDAEERARRRG